MPKNTYNKDQLLKFADRIAADPAVWEELQKAITSPTGEGMVSDLTPEQMQSVFGGAGTSMLDAFKGIDSLHKKESTTTASQATEDLATVLSGADELPDGVINIIDKYTG